MDHHKRHLIILMAIVVFALVSRIASVTYVYRTDPTRILMPDSPTYDGPARALVATGRYAVSPEQPMKPEAIRTPGYPLFIAVHYLLGGQSHYPVMISQILVSAAIIVMTFYLGRKFVSPVVALCAAGLVAIDPVSFLHSQFLITETLFTFFIMLVAFTGIRAIEDEKHPFLWLGLLGGCIALSAYVRPISYYLIVPVLLGLLTLKRIQGASFKLLFKSALVLVLPWLVLVSAWQIRNARELGRSEFCYITNFSILLYRGAGIVALRDHISLTDAQKKVVAGLPAQDTLPLAQVCEIYRREGIKLVRQYPSLFIKTQIKGIFDLLFGMPGGGLRVFYGIQSSGSPFHDFRRLPITDFFKLWVFKNGGALLLSGYVLITAGLLYVGLFFIPWRSLLPDVRRIGIHIFLVGMVAYLVYVAAGPEAYYRFRVPIVPFLAIYSCLGLSSLVSRVTGSHKR